VRLLGPAEDSLPPDEYPLLSNLHVGLNRLAPVASASKNAFEPLIPLTYQHCHTGAKLPPSKFEFCFTPGVEPLKSALALSRGLPSQLANPLHYSLSSALLCACIVLQKCRNTVEASRARARIPAEQNAGAYQLFDFAPLEFICASWCSKGGSHPVEWLRTARARIANYR